MNNNELEMRAGDFGWIVSADALCPDVTTLRDINAVLRFEAREERATRPAISIAKRRTPRRTRTGRSIN